jgi:hypothetical protein
LLLSVKVNQFDPILAALRESLWTFQSDGEDEFDGALSLILRESARSKAGDDPAAKPIQIIGQDYWVLMPLAYLSSSRKELKVDRLIDDEEWRHDSVENITRAKQRELGDQMRAGAFVVERVRSPDDWGGRVIDVTMRNSFPPGRVQRWEVPNRHGNPAVVVYRLRDEPSPIASTSETAGVRRDSTIE